MGIIKHHDLESEGSKFGFGSLSCSRGGVGPDARLRRYVPGRDASTGASPVVSKSERETLSRLPGLPITFLFRYSTTLDK